MGAKERFIGIVAVLALLSFPGRALAQSVSAADRDTARSLMDEGDRKREAADLKGALKAYEAADAIMKVPTTGIEVARTQLTLGLLVEAHETALKVARLAAKPNEPAPFAAARKAADVMEKDLVTRIPSLQITTNAEPGQSPQISIDGEPVPPANAPRKVNPGAHAVLVRLGTSEKKQDVSVVERENKVVTIDLKDLPRSSGDRGNPPGKVDSESSSSGTSTAKILMFTGFGLAAAGVAVGTVTGIMSIGKTNDLKEVCPNNACTADKQAEIDSATTLGNISTVAFIVSGVGAGVGVIGLVLAGSEKKEPAPGARSLSNPTRVRAVLAPSYVGLAGTF